MTTLKTIRYPIDLIEDPDGITVILPDFDDAITSGKTKNVALLNAERLLEELIILVMDEKGDIPKPSLLNNRESITLDPIFSAKVLLYSEMRNQNITKADLARKLDWKYPQVDRLFHAHHESQLSQIVHAASVLNMKFVISLEKIKAQPTSILDIQSNVQSKSVLSKKIDDLLTRRERQVLIYIVNGHSLRQTAKEIALSPRTVEHHWEQILSKLGCSRRKEVLEKYPNIENFTLSEEDLITSKNKKIYESRLTAQESDLSHLISKNKTIDEISEALQYSKRATRCLFKRFMKKMGIDQENHSKSIKGG